MDNHSVADIEKVNQIEEQAVHNPAKFIVKDDKLCPKPVAAGEGTWVENLAASFGVKDPDAANVLMANFVGANSKVNTANCMNINSLIAQVSGLNPKDPAEGMLIMQMVSCHDRTMKLLSAVTEANVSLDAMATHPTIKLVERLMRTYARQMEILTSYRRKGQQKMTIEHITIKKGGQAIVGNIDQGGKTE